MPEFPHLRHFLFQRTPSEHLDLWVQHDPMFVGRLKSANELIVSQKSVCCVGVTTERSGRADQALAQAIGNDADALGRVAGDNVEIFGPLSLGHCPIARHDLLNEPAGKGLYVECPFRFTYLEFNPSSRTDQTDAGRGQSRAAIERVETE